MKAFIIAVILHVGLFCQAFANDDSSDAHLANTISMLFKITGNKDLLNANAYHQKTIVYKGMPITAFKSKSSDWVGFFKTLSANDLPSNAKLAIEKKYADYKIRNTSMFLSTDGEISYFAEIMSDSQCIVLKIEPAGNITVFKCNDGDMTR